MLATNVISGESSPVDTLWEHIRSSMRESKFERTETKQFVPQDTFERMFLDTARSRSDKRIFLLYSMDLQSTNPSAEELALVDYILEKAQKAFLIAVWSRLNPLHAAMKLFKDHGFEDGQLPVENFEISQLNCEQLTHQFIRWENFRLQPKRDGKKKLAQKWNIGSGWEYIRSGWRGYEKKKLAQIWNIHSVHTFYNNQWAFLAPEISTDDQNRSFEDRCVDSHCPIPFIARGEDRRGGAHGIVFEYTIHPAHSLALPNSVSEPQRLGCYSQANKSSQNENEPCVVAVKAFRKNPSKNVADDVKREVDSLARMNQLRDKHIVQFITSFQRGTKEDVEYYVLFEWADGGNLGDFWKLHTSERTASLTKWMTEQLYGLAKALSRAHNLGDDASYRHGDLKPGNILWFRGSAQSGGGYGTLKMGDWGEAKYHLENTRLRHENTTGKPSTRRYEPPETGLQRLQPVGSRHVRSRLYDLWGMGCIIFESVIWLLYGSEGLRRFNHSFPAEYCASDLYYDIDYKKKVATIHPVVEIWMEHMANDPVRRPGTSALGDLLKIVCTGLLVVNLPEDSVSVAQSEVEPSQTGHNVPPSISITGPAPPSPNLLHEAEADHRNRFHASELENEMRLIIERGANEGYWHQDQKPRPLPVDRLEPNA